MLDLLPNELTEYIKHTCINLQIISISDEYPNVKKTVKLFSCSEPISGLFQFSLLTDYERQSLVRLSLENRVKRSIITAISRKVYTLGILLNSLTTTLSDYNEEEVSLHPILAILLSKILLKVKTLYSHPTRILIEVVESNLEDNFTYFPGFTKSYK